MSELREPKVHFPTWCVFCIREYKFTILNDEPALTKHMFEFHKDDMKELVKDLESRVRLDKMLASLADKRREDLHEEETIKFG